MFKNKLFFKKLNKSLLSINLMIQNKLSIKKINKTLLSANKLIESLFNELNFLKFYKKNKKKNLLEVDRKVLLSIVTVAFLVIGYFLIPSFYDKDQVKARLKSQLLKKYNLEVKFIEEVNYGLFPKPHFFTNGLLITHDGNDIAISKYVKIYLSLSNFHSLDQVKTKDFISKKTEFNINSKKIKFFETILNSNKSENKIVF